ncbi:hypothetical protein Cgig2_030941 [Carnegiea gigantea]|uniref:Uncharacterized protein n=1 Tax=Carnegiea gigantea TaxID=171969 RepID=A0A9Q1GKI1_9CARY|nr:hypothetical protein Cgig2_030941 [Carnegiea gigantea]
MKTRPLRGQPPLRMVTSRGEAVKPINARLAPTSGDGQTCERVFVWRWKRALRLTRPLLENFHALCPRFSLPKAKGVATDFELPEMVQATFYAMLWNEAVELGVASGFMAEGLKSALVGLRWSSFEVWMNCVDHELREAQLWWQAVAVEEGGLLDGQEESSGSNCPPVPSSDEE